MRKIIYAGVMVITLIALTVTMGCSAFSSSKTSSAKVLRESPIGAKWLAYQLEVTLPAGSSLPVTLGLADTDIVEGYFYVISGDKDVDLTLKGLTQFYKSNITNLPTGTPVSDRFTFTASAATQGLSYTLTLTNNNPATDKTKSTVFLEIMYPGTNPPSIPITK